MDILLVVVSFFVVLLIVVLVHELGHFSAAKKFGVKVEEFGVGFPPRAYSKKYKGTEYSINWLPFGGYVRLFGEDDRGSLADGSFQSVSTFRRLIVILAGPAFNIFLTIIMFTIALSIGLNTVVTEENNMYIGDKSLILNSVIADGALDGKIEPGSTITHAIVDEETIEINSIADLKGITSFNSVIVGYTDDGDDREVVIELEDGLLGGYFSEMGELKYPIHKSIYYSIKHTFALSGLILVSIYDLAASSIAGEGDFSALSGPVGIAVFAGEAALDGLSKYIFFIGILSLNLGVLNLIPFPALDGSRALLIIYEIIVGKRISNIFEKVFNAIGFSILIILIVLITIKDIHGLF